MKSARILLSTLLALTVGACSVLEPGTAPAGLTASGVVAATSVSVTAEVGGKALDISVVEGDSVEAGDVLFTVDCRLLQAQRDQAATAIGLANATVAAAEAQQQYAQIQVALTRQGVTQQETPSRIALWNAPADDTLSVPNWYFQQSEQLTATQAELDAAEAALKIEQANLQNELEKASNADFVAAENRLAQAQMAYQSASLTDSQALAASDHTELQIASQALLPPATHELKAPHTTTYRISTHAAAHSVGSCPLAG